MMSNTTNNATFLFSLLVYTLLLLSFIYQPTTLLWRNYAAKRLPHTEESPLNFNLSQIYQTSHIRRQTEMILMQYAIFSTKFMFHKFVNIDINICRY